MSSLNPPKENVIDANNDESDMAQIEDGGGVRCSDKTGQVELGKGEETDERNNTNGNNGVKITERNVPGNYVGYQIVNPFLPTWAFLFYSGPSGSLSAQTPVPFASINSQSPSPSGSGSNAAITLNTGNHSLTLPNMPDYDLSYYYLCATVVATPINGSDNPEYYLAYLYNGSATIGTQVNVSTFSTTNTYITLPVQAIEQGGTGLQYQVYVSNSAPDSSHTFAIQSCNLSVFRIG